MNDTALIFGAGKTGRGFAAHLAYLGGYDIILIDKNHQLIKDLKTAGSYDIDVIGNDEMNCTIQVSSAYSVDDTSWHDDFVSTTLVFTSVFGNNLEELSNYLAAALQKRYSRNPTRELTIITCENLTNSARILKNFVLKHFDIEKEGWLSGTVGFSESIIFKTCLGASTDQSSLTVRAQNFFKLPCDSNEIKEGLHVFGFEPLRDFNNQLRRKIYTYNCINAVIAYLGAIKGYSQLHEAANDPEIIIMARKAASESCFGLVAEFGFDIKEQQDWVNAAFEKFSDNNIPDPIERNAADPKRKLGRDDRLIGPALLAVKHGRYPEGLLAGIMACFQYRDPNINSTVENIIRESGVDYVLMELCGLIKEDQLFVVLKDHIIKSSLDGKQ